MIRCGVRQHSLFFQSLLYQQLTDLKCWDQEFRASMRRFHQKKHQLVRNKEIVDMEEEVDNSQYVHISAKQIRNNNIRKRDMEAEQQHSSSYTATFSVITKRHCTTLEEQEEEDGLIHETAPQTPEIENMDAFPPTSVETKKYKGSSTTITINNDIEEFMHGKLGIISKEITSNLVAFMRKNLHRLTQFSIDNIIESRRKMNARLKTDLSKGWDCASILKVSN